MSPLQWTWPCLWPYAGGSAVTDVANLQNAVIHQAAVKIC